MAQVNKFENRLGKKLSKNDSLFHRFTLGECGSSRGNTAFMAKELPKEFILQKLRSADKNEIQKALAILSALKDENTVNYIALLLDHENENLVNGAINTLAAIGSKNIFPYLHNVLNGRTNRFEKKEIFLSIVYHLRDLPEPSSLQAFLGSFTPAQIPGGSKFYRRGNGKACSL